MKRYLIKNKKFTHDEEIIDGLNYVQELSLSIKFYNRDLTFVFQSVKETYDYYKTHFFSRELKKKTGLDFYFTSLKIDINDFSAKEVRRILKINGYLNYTDWLVIRYEYETCNWYFEDFDKPINNDCKNVLSSLVDKIIDICEK